MAQTINAEVTIASGTGVTIPLATIGKAALGIYFPSTMTNTSFNLQTSTTLSPGDFVDMYDDSGTQLTVTVVDGYARLDPINTVGAAYFRLQSSTNEDADRVLKISLQEV